MSASKKPKELPGELSLAAICHLLAVNKQRIAQLVDAGIVIRTERGRYSVESIPRFVKWQRTTSNDPKAMQDAKLNLMVEKVEAARFERKIREGEYVKLREFGAAWLRHIVVVRTRLLAMATKLAPRLLMKHEAAEVERIIADEVREVLEDLANTEPSEIGVYPDGEAPK